VRTAQRKGKGEIVGREPMVSCFCKQAYGARMCTKERSLGCWWRPEKGNRERERERER
jgi:hypothetical protein